MIPTVGDKAKIAEVMCGNDLGGLSCTEPMGHSGPVHVAAILGPPGSEGTVLGVWYFDKDALRLLGVKL